MSYADGKILTEIDHGIGLITFNQPAKRNAMSVDMWVGLAEALDAFGADDDVRVVVLTGAGPKAFVSGADISQFGEKRDSAEAQREYDSLTSAGRAKLAALPKPVIARIQGFCLGGGLGIALQADLRIAGDSAMFGIPAAKLGLAYGFEMVRRLVATVGHAHARTILFTGERIEADEAGRIGLVNRVVPDQDLSDVVVDLARTIADNAPLTIRAAKLAVEQALRDPADRDRAAMDSAIAACFDSADYREGRTAFMDKRVPKFVGA